MLMIPVIFKKMCIFVCIRQNIINLYSLLESIHFNIVITHGNSIGAQKCLWIDGYELCCKTAVKQKIFTTLTLMLSNCLFSLVSSVFTTKTLVFVTANGNESLESDYYNG